MFKNIYDSLSVEVHLELLLSDDLVCIKTWSEINEDQYNQEHKYGDRNDDSWAGWRNHNPGVFPNKDGVERSLKVPDIKYMEFPGDVEGIYHKRLPTCRLSGEKKKGEDFLPNIPAEIRDSYTSKLTGKYFQLICYSWIDPSDPSVMSGELSDVACWSIGVHYNGFLSPSCNTIPYTFDTKAHPLRESRRQQTPVALMLYQQFKDDKFTDCSMTLKYNRGFGFSTNILTGWSKGSGYNYLDQMMAAFPKFEVTSGGGTIDADGTDTVEFKMIDSDDNTIDKNTTVYLEHTGGYLPKKRVTLTNGTGSFKVKALGLESSDTFKVKIGFKTLTGITDINYTVN